VGQYVVEAPPGILSAAWLNGEYTKIATAFNTHAQGDFPNRCVPQTALQSTGGAGTNCRRTQFFAKIGYETAVTPGAALVRAATYLVTRKCELMSVDWIAMVATGSPTCLINKNSPLLGTANQVTGIKTIAAAQTRYTSTILADMENFVPGDRIHIWARVTAAPAQTLAGLMASLHFKTDHTQ
jgi:hypothetical protein